MAVDPSTFLRSVWMFLQGLFWAVVAAKHTMSCHDVVPRCSTKREYFKAVRELAEK